MLYSGLSSTLVETVIGYGDVQGVQSVSDVTAAITPTVQQQFPELVPGTLEVSPIDETVTEPEEPFPTEPGELEEPTDVVTQGRST